MPAVLIAHDHARLRSGLRRYLGLDAAVTTVGESATGAAVLSALRSRRWDLLLLAWSVRDGTRLEALRAIRAAHPDTPVVVVSGCGEERYALQVLQTGAAGFLATTSVAADLGEAVRTVLSGRRYLGAALVDLYRDDNGEARDPPRHGSLSGRELQILTELARGRAVSSIAADLKLSAKTVSTYRTRTLLKLGVRSNTELTSYALRHRLID